MTWPDAEEIGMALAEAFPDTDPLSVRFTDLRAWVAALEGFSGNPLASNESLLEAIQMAWYEEWKDRRG